MNLFVPVPKDSLELSLIEQTPIYFLRYNILDSQTMKYFIAVLALSVFGQDGLAFSVQKGNAFRSSSSLYMTVEEKETKMVKVGVIGCGRIGLVHLEAITKAPGVTPVIVSNPTVSKAEAGEI